MIAPPGYPNRVSTPSSSSVRTSISAPVGRLDFAPSAMAGTFSLRAEPGHFRTKPSPDLLDRVIAVLFEQRRVSLEPARMFFDPEPCEFARTDIGEDVAHQLAGMLIDQPWSLRQRTELGGLRDELVHLGKPAFVEEIDDEL